MYNFDNLRHNIGSILDERQLIDFHLNGLTRLVSLKKN